MPPSTHLRTAGLSLPVINATATAHRFRQVEVDVAATASASSSSDMPLSFIGAGTAGGGKGVALGVSVSVVAVVLIVLVVALSVHMDAGKGRYRQGARKQQGHGADTIQLRRPQHARHQNASPVAVRGQNSTDAIIPGRPSAPYSPKPGSWKSTLDSKIARTLEVARNWRA